MALPAVLFTAESDSFYLFYAKLFLIKKQGRIRCLLDRNISSRSRLIKLRSIKSVISFKDRI